MAFLMARLIEHKISPTGSRANGLVLGLEARRVLSEYIVPDLLAAMQKESLTATSPTPHHVRPVYDPVTDAYGVRGNCVDRATLILVACLWLQDRNLVRGLLFSSSSSSSTLPFFL